MKKFLIAATLATFSAGTAYADSSRPACPAGTVAPEYRGKYQTTTDDGKPEILTITESRFTTGQLPGLTAKTWTCKLNGVDVWVIEFPGQNPPLVEGFENNVFLKTGDFIVSLTELHCGDKNCEDAEQAMKKSLANKPGGHLGYMKKITE